MKLVDVALFVVAAIVLFGCGGSWAAQDATNAQDIANGALSLEQVCDRDGGPCPAAAVRAMERGTYCAAASMLYRHKEAIPDAGVACVR